MEEGKVWNLVLEKIKNDVTNITFKNYFKQTVLHSLTYNTAKIICNSGNIQKEFIEKYYFNNLKKYFLEVTENNVDVILITKDDLESEETIICLLLLCNSLNILKNSSCVVFVVPND